MSSSCIEEVSVPNDDWYRIAAELLGRAGIEINGSAPSDLRVKNPLFFKRVLQEGSLGLGESYMDGWWECERLDIFFHKVLRAGLEKQLPHHFKDTLRIAGARLFNLQSKNVPRIVGKEHYDLGNDLFSRMLDPYMQYSCGYWKEAQSLEAAQQAKLDLICRKLELEPRHAGTGYWLWMGRSRRIYGAKLSGQRRGCNHLRRTAKMAQCALRRSRCRDSSPRIIAICTTALTASSPLACLSTWGRKITLPTLRLPTVI